MTSSRSCVASPERGRSATAGHWIRSRRACSRCTSASARGSSSSTSAPGRPTARPSASGRRPRPTTSRASSVPPMDRPPAAPRSKRPWPASSARMEQRPPAYSARKIGGRRAYALARRGETPRAHATRRSPSTTCDSSAGTPPIPSSRPPSWTSPARAGTYVRALARDLGAAVGNAGYLGALRRTASGPFTLGRRAPARRRPRGGGRRDVRGLLLPVDAGLDDPRADARRRRSSGPSPTVAGSGRVERLGAARGGDAGLDRDPAARARRVARRDRPPRPTRVSCPDKVLVDREPADSLVGREPADSLVGRDAAATQPSMPVVVNGIDALRPERRPDAARRRRLRRPPPRAPLPPARAAPRRPPAGRATGRPHLRPPSRRDPRGGGTAAAVRSGRAPRAPRARRRRGDRRGALRRGAAADLVRRLRGADPGTDAGRGLPDDARTPRSGTSDGARRPTLAALGDDGRVRGRRRAALRSRRAARAQHRDSLRRSPRATWLRRGRSSAVASR